MLIVLGAFATFIFILSIFIDKYRTDALRRNFNKRERESINACYKAINIFESSVAESVSFIMRSHEKSSNLDFLNKEYDFESYNEKIKKADKNLEKTLDDNDFWISYDKDCFLKYRAALHDYYQCYMRNCHIDEKEKITSEMNISRDILYGKLKDRIS